MAFFFGGPLSRGLVDGEKTKEGKGEARKNLNKSSKPRPSDGPRAKGSVSLKKNKGVSNLLRRRLNKMKLKRN